MKRAKHINMTDPKIIDQSIRQVLGNHKRRRCLWLKLSRDNRPIREIIADHARKWAAATGQPVAYEMARKQIFGTIRQREEREQLQEIIAYDESKTADQNIGRYIKWVAERIERRDWIPDEYREFWINDGIRQKRRKIAATTIKSQIFHWVLIKTISPIIMRVCRRTRAPVYRDGAHTMAKSS